MKATFSHTFRGLLAGAVLGLLTFSARGDDPFVPFESYIKITGYGTSVKGSESAFKRGTGEAPEGGGIEALLFKGSTAKDVYYEAEGRAMLGSEDYLARLKFNKDEVGSIEAGYKRFRTFYDGVGGFFPTNGRFLALTNRDLFVDRGRFWVEAKTALPDKPVFSLSYSNELRNGRKNSTIWGSSSLTGLPFNVAPNPITPVRKFAPSYIDLGERQQELTFTVKHTIKNTTVELVATHAEIDNLNTRYVMNSPGQSTPFPTPSNAALALMDPVTWANQQSYTQTDGLNSESDAIILKSSTVLTDKLTLRLRGSYQKVRADLSGDRDIISWTPAAGGVVNQVRTTNYTALTGYGNVDTYTGIVSLDYKPTKTLFLMAGVRADDIDSSSRSDFGVVAANGSSTPRVAWAKRETKSNTPVVEARYTGIKGLSLYAKGSMRSLSGESRNTSAYNPNTAANGTLAINDNSESRDQFTVGAVWNATKTISLRTELFTKQSSTEALGFDARLGDFYRIESDMQGLKLTGVVKAMENVSVTGRYVYQNGEMRTKGYQPLFPIYDSGEVEHHDVGGTIAWSPTKQSWVQLNGNVVYNVLSTIYPRAGAVAPSGANVGYDTNRVLQNANANYVTGSMVCGWAMAEKTDASFRVTYYRTDNGNAEIASHTMPYGAEAREYSITAGIKHKVSDRLVINARVGYLDSRNDTLGGNANYKGPLACLSFEHAL